MAQFMLLCLPRSRSNWFSKFLAYDGRIIGHDLLVHSDTIAEFQRHLDSCTGSCETGAMLGWKLLVTSMPNLKFIIIRRDPVEVLADIERKGWTVPLQTLIERDEMLEAMSHVKGVRQYQFNDLDDVEAVKDIWFHALGGVLWDHQWWLMWRATIVEIDFDARIAELRSRAAPLARLVAEVQSETSKLGGLMPCRLN